MSDPNKSFFSGLHLAITGTAAFITSVVAVLGLALNQGWLGGGHSKSSGTATATSTTTPGAAPGDTSSTVFGGTSLPGVGSSNGVPSFTVDPPKLVFASLGQNDLAVTVTNTGTRPITVQSPSLSGADRAQFTVTDLGCAGSLDPGKSCQIKVTFKRAPGNFSANVVVQVAGAPQEVDVSILANSIL